MSNPESNDWNYLMIWEFRPQVGSEKQFEEAYGPHGIWARLFARGDGFIATELIRDLAATNRYLTMDMWTSKTAYEKFREEFAEEYRSIDARCEALTAQEQSLGYFERRRS